MAWEWMEQNRPEQAAQRKKIPADKRCFSCGGYGINVGGLSDQTCGSCKGTGRVQSAVQDRFAKEIDEFGQWLDQRISAVKQEAGYYERAAKDSRKRKQPMTALTHEVQSDMAKSQLKQLVAMREQWWL
jgi:hypothetical protein